MVTLHLSSGPAGAVFTSVSATAVNGVATFSALVFKTAGTYILKAMSGSLASATSVSFKVNAAAASKVVFLKPPVNTKLNAVMTPSLVVAIEDAFGNIVTSNTSKVTISIASGTAGAMTGTLSRSAVAGLATFSGLIFKKAGKYTLKAVDGTLTSAVSVSFSIA